MLIRKKENGEFRMDLRHYDEVARNEAITRTLEEISRGSECRLVSDMDLSEILAKDAHIRSGQVRIVGSSQWNGAFEVLLSGERQSDAGCCGVCGGH